MNKTNIDLIIENYLRNPFRSFGLSLLIALFASVLLVGGAFVAFPFEGLETARRKAQSSLTEPILQT